MLKEVIRHPVTHIALALATGLPLACARPAESDDFQYNAPTPAPGPNVIFEPNTDPTTWQADRMIYEYWLKNLTISQMGQTGSWRIERLESPDPQIIAAKFASRIIIGPAISNDRSKDRTYHNRGFLEAKDFRVQTTAVDTLSPADRANGHQWGGTIKLDLVTRSKFNQSRDIEPDYPTAKKPFGPWRDSSRTFKVRLVNNAWQVEMRHVDTAYPPHSNTPVDLAIIIPCTTNSCSYP